MPAGGAPGAMTAREKDEPGLDTERGSRDASALEAKQAALARLGFGGNTGPSDYGHEIRTSGVQGQLHDMRNRHRSVLPPGMTTFAAQYPLTTVAGIGALATTVLIGSSALTALALRRLIRGPRGGVRTVDIERQMADMERRLSQDISGMRSELRRLQQDGKGGRQLSREDLSFQVSFCA